MLDLTVFMNSDVEEILEFKCCNLPDLNLEIHIRNMGENSIVAPSNFYLVGAKETLKVENVYPPWEQVVEPGDLVAIYCCMDQNVWRRFKRVKIFDAEGRDYYFPCAKA